jgi:2-dehydropantoate 2-reductase
MKLAIVGSGGVGGVLAALLARAGEEVVVVARGAQRDAIAARGLELDSSLGRFTVRPAAVSDAPAALAPADAVLVAVKAWQVEGIAPSLAPLVRDGGVVVPLQNGVEAAGRLAAALGERAVAGGLVNVLAWLDAPGRVKHIGAAPRVTVGERGAAGRRPSPRLEALAAALGKAGVEVTVTDDIERASWEKFLLIEPWGAVSAAARAPMGAVRSVPETRALMRTAMEELVATGRARGVALPDDAIARAFAILDGVPPEGTASMQRDLAAGRPSELDDQVGAVVRLARDAGVPVPAHAFLYATLRPMDAAARGQIPPFTRT